MFWRRCNRMATISLDTLSKQPFSHTRINGFSALRKSPTSSANVTMVMMMAVDILSVSSALVLALTLGLNRWVGPVNTLKSVAVSGTPLPWQLGYLAWFIVTLLMVAHHHGLYGHTLTYSKWNEQRKTMQSCFTAGLLLCGAMYMMHNVAISRAVVVYLICLTTLFFCVSRMGWRYFAFRRFERGLDSRNVIIVGVSGMGLALSRKIERNRHLGRVFKGFVEIPGSNAISQAPTRS